MRSARHRPRPRPRLPAVVLVVGLALPAVALAACGGDDEVTRTTDEPTDEGGDGEGSTTVPSPDAGVLLITLDVHGGFVPLEHAVADTADVVVQGDGSVLAPAPTILIYPGPALPAFQRSTAPTDEVRALAEAVEALGADADLALGGDVAVADAPDTTVTLRRGAEVVVTLTANALGAAGEEVGPRAELAAVVDRIRALGGGADGDLYEPTALRLHDVTDQAGDPPAATTVPTDPAAPGEPSGRVVDWPLPHDGRPCTVVSDPADVAAALEVLADATQLDWFKTDAGVRRLVAVPVLPGDPACPDG